MNMTEGTIALKEALDHHKEVLAEEKERAMQTSVETELPMLGDSRRYPRGQRIVN